MSDFMVVFVTTKDIEEAERIAMALIDSGLAPCVNILPSCTSIYRWEGERHKDTETLMIIKSRTDLFDRLRETVERAHSYDVPEIIALPLRHVSEAYGAYLGSFFE